ncbi:hypothetical protein [Modicisalibacter sp. 'Wilcox']|uniref:hypothetical protein n=1 Tax=Modicisalibacter sp. 'Wilcox' TaxID=2679914 RepID=UPI0013D4CF5F|nr:hypothetical protein [Modicisalibacter sp. 'Wilcox']
MTTTTIHHDRERFMSALSGALADPEHGGVMAAVDVVASDARPGELMLVAQDDVTRDWYSDGRRYTRYRDALMALGEALDAINSNHAPLTWHWAP